MRVRGTNVPALSSHGQFVAALLLSCRKALAASAVVRVVESRPEIVAAAGSTGFGDLHVLCEGLVEHVAQAAIVERPELYAHQTVWLKQALAARKIDLEALRLLLAALRDEFAASLPSEAARTSAAIAETGRATFEAAPIETAGPLDVAGPFVDLSRRYMLAILEGRRVDAIRLAEDAIANGTSITDVYSKVLGRAQIEIGRMWQHGEIHVAEEHLCSRITEQVMAAVHARMPCKAWNGKRVLVTSASGDLHDIGLRMVADHFEMAGWEVVFLGASTPAEDVASAVHDFDVDLVAVSAKLVLHVRAAAELIQAVRATSRGRTLPILVGGSPFQIVDDLWQLVGADGMARSAVGAVAVGDALTARVA